MSDTQQARTISVHIPVTLLSLAIAAFLASQIGAASRTSGTIDWQLGNLDKGLTELRQANKQLGELNTKADEEMKKAQAVQEQWTKLFKDVIDLSKSDKDVQAVVEKWKIQVNEPAPAADAKPADKPKQP
jgi:hypothetical protein